MFKVYQYDTTTPIICNSIAELADLCGVSIGEARRMFYRVAGTVGGFEVVNLN
jgi:hypothetical protein